MANFSGHALFLMFIFILPIQITLESSGIIEINVFTFVANIVHSCPNANTYTENSNLLSTRLIQQEIYQLNIHFNEFSTDMIEIYFKQYYASFHGQFLRKKNKHII